MRTQLLCTFAEKSECKTVISKIFEQYKIVDRKFFVFEDCNDKTLFITYNVFIDLGENLQRFPMTISIHRKKQTNTLYTLNALNRIIMEENNGVLDKNFKLNWDIYKNCLILTSDMGYRIIDLRLVDIVNL